MKITQIREITIPLGSNMRNAYVDFSTMTASLVAVVSDRIVDGAPIVGYGFSSPGRFAQGDIIRERAIPRIVAAQPASLLAEDGLLDPFKVQEVMRKNEKPGGHGDRSVAFGTVDAAMWDLAAKVRDLPLAQYVSNLYGSGSTAESVWVYAAGGYYTDGGGVSSLVDELRSYRDQGFTEVKMKIGGLPLIDDLKRVEAAASAVGASHLAVDANGRFNLEQALAYGSAMESLGLLWYEEAGDPLDFMLNAELCANYSNAVATGENLFSVQDMVNLLRFGGMRSDRDLLQMDPALSYGPTEFIKMVLAAEELGWSRKSFVPHGGHQLNLALAAGLGLGGTECYPGVFAPIGGFLDATEVTDGRVAMTSAPGVGIEHKATLWEAFAPLRDGL